MSDFSKIAISLLLSLGRKHLLKKSSDSSIHVLHRIPSSVSKVIGKLA